MTHDVRAGDPPAALLLPLPLGQNSGGSEEMSLVFRADMQKPEKFP